MNKVYPDTHAALAGLLRDDMTIMSGGFGLCGVPEQLIATIRQSGVRGLTMISNNAGIDGAGLGLLLESRQIRKMISSYVGENKLFEQLYLQGELELEFTPQGTLAEGKEIREFDGESYVMERGLVADLALIHAWQGDSEGNLVYRKTARNFNPIMATAAHVTVAEVEHLVEPGMIEPDHIHTPGIFVQRIVNPPS